MAARTSPGPAAVPPPSAGWAPRTGRFCRLFVPHVLVAPLGFVVAVTFLHEAAHAAMALALGGRVTDFAFLPDGRNLGHVRWEPPPGAPGWYADLVLGAPYLLWCLLAATAAALALRRRRPRPAWAAAAFFWLYVVPVGDFGWNLLSPSGDLALGGLEGLLFHAAGALGLLAAYAVGYLVQRRLFGERAVDVAGYLAASLVVGAASAAAGAAGLLVFSGS